ncbi:unnamed protein product [[Actinomadura] parvosata subsp. kistnae]|nr:unnamed protein product [Actinomadura parvosata subsp. kistnae]
MCRCAARTGAVLLLPLSDTRVAAAAPTPEPQQTAATTAATAKGPAEAPDQALARLMAMPVRGQNVAVTQ